MAEIAEQLNNAQSKIKVLDDLPDATAMIVCTGGEAVDIKQHRAVIGIQDGEYVYILNYHGRRVILTDRGGREIDIQTHPDDAESVIMLNNISPCDAKDLAILLRAAASFIMTKYMGRA